MMKRVRGPILAIVLLAGCSHQPTAEELGRIVPAPPKVDKHPGMMPVPELDSPGGAEGSVPAAEGEEPGAAPSTEPVSTPDAPPAGDVPADFPPESTP